MNRLFDQIDLPARLLLSAIFILSGLGKLSAIEATQGYMEAFGVPGFLLIPTVLFEVGAGLAVALGIFTRLAAFALAGFSVVSALLFHAALGDQIQLIMFLKNLAMAGGLLLLAKHGAGEMSLDAWLAGRRQALQG